ESPRPLQWQASIGTFASIARLDSDGSHNCVLFADGTGKCWGAGLSGRLGTGDAENRGDDPFDMGPALVSIDLGAGAMIRDLATGSDFSCAILESDEFKCWGRLGGYVAPDLMQTGVTPEEMG